MGSTGFIGWVIQGTHIRGPNSPKTPVETWETAGIFRSTPKARLASYTLLILPLENIITY